ncbi:hypothetical protein [Bradyrhizobium sp. WSM1253]|uniref:hypothetical protein n=1 Tax=Bradyrhizobium sp. WSM1253 TaxID=319003 RepID=UPI00025D2A6A|nr:hypothetical protein [Bradyrhizobium sp. WSM1253]EIG61398.1 hypothetical protein Bra1253DRAFT_06243 [Bradyrhizobium sp. WSM1253]
MFQQYALFPWRTAAQNVEFGLDIAGLKAKQRQRLAGARGHWVIAGPERMPPRSSALSRRTPPSALTSTWPWGLRSKALPRPHRRKRCGPGAGLGRATRNTLRVLLAGAVALGLTAPAFAEPPLEKTEIRYQGSAGQVTFIELAEDLGYVAPLKLKWVGNTISGPQDIQAVVTGDIDIGGARAPRAADQRGKPGIAGCGLDPRRGPRAGCLRAPLVAADCPVGGAARRFRAGRLRNHAVRRISQRLPPIIDLSFFDANSSTSINIPAVGMPISMSMSTTVGRCSRSVAAA